MLEGALGYRLQVGQVIRSCGSHRGLLVTTMAPTKKSATSPKTRSSTSQTKISLKRVKGENFYRDAKKAARTKMLTGGKPIRDRAGNIIKAAAFQKGEDETKPGRVQPDRRWFGAPMQSYVDLLLLTLRREYQGDLSNCVGSFPDQPCEQER